MGATKLSSSKGNNTQSVLTGHTQRNNLIGRAYSRGNNGAWAG